MSKITNPLFYKALKEMVNRQSCSPEEALAITLEQDPLLPENRYEGFQPYAPKIVSADELMARVMQVLADMPDSSDVFAEENRTFAVEHGSRDDTFTWFQANSQDENYRDLAGVIVMHVLNSEQ
jgi:hypothetical protein